eukprot:gnl/TRDRNA2_/TRDRNA2_176990_c0_seq1.p1 gnl/TRDRNA2_/TRDRNA2_176990_c0~~gnl/TRDRNA2_/TRDRNA2_176990_c0_seq1.p1  ORF type:complete len:528 (-),score=63.89 gnl/TRDRNA2_/TRDRNA2_176990_c0_seq1:274-1857(-)
MRLNQIKSNSPRWKTDGLSNLAFRILSSEDDTNDRPELGVTYHHVRVRRGLDGFDLSTIPLAVPASLCPGLQDDVSGWTIGNLGKPFPWDLAALRTRTIMMLNSAVSSSLDAASVAARCKDAAATVNFILVDRRGMLAKVLSDGTSSDPHLLTVFYRSLEKPGEDGIVIADHRSHKELTAAFEATSSRLVPPAEYSICTSRMQREFRGAGPKYSVQLGQICKDGWEPVPRGVFKAYTVPRPGMRAVSLCEQTTLWTQHIAEGDTCPSSWGDDSWSFAGTFWVHQGDAYCVGTRRTTVKGFAFSRAMARKKCDGEGFDHDFGFSSADERPQLPSGIVCVGRRATNGGHFRIEHGKDCSRKARRGWKDPPTRFPARLGSLGVTHANGDVGLCVVKGASQDRADELRPAGTCGKAERFSFALPGNGTRLLGQGVQSRQRACVGPAMPTVAPGAGVQFQFGLGDECDRHVQTSSPDGLDFELPSLHDLAASTPLSPQAATTDSKTLPPLYVLVDEGSGCVGFLCPAMEFWS